MWTIFETYWSPATTWATDLKIAFFFGRDVVCASCRPWPCFYEKGRWATQHRSTLRVTRINRAAGFAVSEANGTKFRICSL
jgi:hypothetical protein